MKNETCEKGINISHVNIENMGVVINPKRRSSKNNKSVLKYITKSHNDDKEREIEIENESWDMSIEL